jgi:UDP-N-acetyl-D-glucosamine dehydrogenase
MIELASSINESMPHYVVDRVAFLLNDRQTALKQAKVLVLGVSYKRNIDDMRESPAIDVIEGLVEKGADVSYSDPYVPGFLLNGKKFKSKPLTPALLKKQSCVLVLTDHASFDYDAVVKHSRMILDTRNVLRRHKASRNVRFL